MAAQAVEEAVERAVLEASSLAGIPALQEIKNM
jgi:L-aminopeptidase/D-esterase-like protein